MPKRTLSHLLGQVAAVETLRSLARAATTKVRAAVARGGHRSPPPSPSTDPAGTCNRRWVWRRAAAIGSWGRTWCGSRRARRVQHAPSGAGMGIKGLGKDAEWERFSPWSWSREGGPSTVPPSQPRWSGSAERASRSRSWSPARRPVAACCWSPGAIRRSLRHRSMQPRVRSRARSSRAD